VWDEKEESIMIDEIVQGNGWPRDMTMELRSWVHEFVISNSSDLAEWRE
jgi:hypothetical protein